MMRVFVCAIMRAQEKETTNVVSFAVVALDGF